MEIGFDLAVFVLFWLMVICNVIIAIAFGRSTERVFATFLLVASALTLVVRRIDGGIAAGLDLVVLLDWAILVVAWFLSIRSDRYWPVWFAAMQSLSVITHGVSLMVEGVPHLIFSNLAAVWSLPALMTMSWGTIQDWRGRQPRQAPTPSRARAG